MEKQDKEFCQSIYCYEGTSILINNFYIKNKKKLDEIEKLIFIRNLSKLISDNYPFKLMLDEKHYLKLHEYLFKDLYPFAGKIRDEVISKQNNKESNEEGKRIYCNPNLINTCLKNQLQLMKKQAINITSREELVDFLANNYLELYFIHPFREGNSRTLREFMREYVLMLNKHILKEEQFYLDYTQLTKTENEKFVLGTIWNISKDKEKQEKSIELIKDAFEKSMISFNNIKQQKAM